MHSKKPEGADGAGQFALWHAIAELGLCEDY